MPTWVFTSPAVVIVRMPVSQVSASVECGTGSQRYWPRDRDARQHVRRRFPVRHVDACVARGMLDRGPDPIAPGPLGRVGGEGGAGQLFAVQAIVALLRASSCPAARRRAAPRSQSRCRSRACSPRPFRRIRRRGSCLREVRAVSSQDSPPRDSVAYETKIPFPSQQCQPVSLIGLCIDGWNSRSSRRLRQGIVIERTFVPPVSVTSCRGAASDRGCSVQRFDAAKQ